MKGILQKVFQRKSEFLMLAAGICILISIFMIALYDDFTFWKITKFFYAIGVGFILFDK